MPADTKDHPDYPAANHPDYPVAKNTILLERDSESDEWRVSSHPYRIKGGRGFAAELADEFEDRLSHQIPINHPSYLSHALSSFNASLYSNSNEILSNDLLQRFAEFMAQDRSSSSSAHDPYNFAWHDINRAAHMSGGFEIASCESGPGFGIPQLKELRPQSPFQNPLPCPIPDGPSKLTLSDRIQIWKDEQVNESLGDNLVSSRVVNVGEGEENEPGNLDSSIREREGGRSDSPTRGYDEEAVDGGQLWPRFGAYQEDELPERRGKGVGALKASVVDVNEGNESE
jgi:hypothetical protein